MYAKATANPKINEHAVQSKRLFNVGIPFVMLPKMSSTYPHHTFRSLFS